MPQLDSSTFVTQLFWLALCFGIVVFMFARVFIPRFNAILEQRINKIQGDVDQAFSYEKQTAELLARYENELLLAKEKADHQIKQAVSDLQEKKRLQLAHVDQEMAHNMKSAEIALIKQHEQMTHALSETANECAHQIVERLILSAKATT